MLIRSEFDLSADARARRYVKREIVAVRFAAVAGAVSSREGANRYVEGDALITGSNGDQWSVSRERFVARYQPLPGTVAGQNGQYCNLPLPVLALQQPGPFRVERSAGGDVIAGAARDWLLQYAPGDLGIVANSKFQLLYRVTE